MKTLNRRLLVTTGLFVAFCGLTSFNPFTQSTHLSALQKEESITLAQQTANRTAERSGGDAQHTAGGINQKIQAGQQQNPGQKDHQAKPADSSEKEQPTVKKDEDKKQTSAGVTCPDGKDCSKSKGVLAEILAKANISDEQRAEILKQAEAKGVQSSREDDEFEEFETVEATICVGDGSSSYRDLNSRIKCFEKESRAKGSRKSQRLSDLKDSMRALFDDILASELKQSEKLLSKLLRVAKIDRQLSTDIKVAIKDYEVQKEYAQFERDAERIENDYNQANANIDNYVQHLQMMGVSPSFAEKVDDNFRNMLRQRDDIRNALTKRVAKLQNVVRTSVPRESDGESSYIARLREDRETNYLDAIQPYADSKLIDERFTTLDMNQVFTNNSYSSTNYSSNSGSSWNQNQNGVWTNNGQNYNNMDPMGVNGNQRPLFPNQLRTGNYNNMNNNFAMNNGNNWNTNMPVINNGQQMPNNMTQFPRN